MFERVVSKRVEIESLSTTAISGRHSKSSKFNVKSMPMRTRKIQGQMTREDIRVKVATWNVAGRPSAPVEEALRLDGDEHPHLIVLVICRCLLNLVYISRASKKAPTRSPP